MRRTLTPSARPRKSGGNPPKEEERRLAEAREKKREERRQLEGEIRTAKAELEQRVRASSWKPKATPKKLGARSRS